MSDFDSKKALDKLGAFARDSAGALQDKAAEIRKKKKKATKSLKNINFWTATVWI